MRTWLAALVLWALAVPAAVAQPTLADLPYGSEPRQSVDVYLPAQPRGPILVMVHGGAWMAGHKRLPAVVDAKLQHWVREQGWILVSVGYRLVPQVQVPQQGEDVARAIALVQARAAGWGGDPGQLLLMGHSAGAHLVALASASPQLLHQAGARPWRGTVVLDSAALDTTALMQRRHLRFYDRAFGGDPAVWRAASPTDALGAGPPPMPLLLVCSQPRGDGSCAQSQQFAARVRALGGQAQVLEQPLDHHQINAELGSPGAYTRAVDAFIASLGLARP